MEFIGYFASLIMGLIIGLLGGGGSILTVPILVYFFALGAADATAASLFIVAGVALVSTIQYRIKEKANWKLGIWFALPSLIGIYFARKVALPGIPDQVRLPLNLSVEKDSLVLLAFAALMITASISMIKSHRPHSEDDKDRSNVLIGLQGVIVGFVTGFVGAGGGFLILPILVKFIKVPMRVAVGTSLFIIAVNSSFGFAVSFFNDKSSVDWLLLLKLVVLAIIGALIGAKLSARIDEVRLRHSFGWFVLVVGIVIIVERLAI